MAANRLDHPWSSKSDHSRPRMCDRACDLWQRIIKLTKCRHCFYQSYKKLWCPTNWKTIENTKQYKKNEGIHRHDTWKWYASFHSLATQYLNCGNEKIFFRKEVSFLFAFRELMLLLLAYENEECNKATSKLYFTELFFSPQSAWKLFAFQLEDIGA